MSDDSAPLPPFIKTIGLFLAVWAFAYCLVDIGLAQTPLPAWLGEKHADTVSLSLGGYLTWLLRCRSWLPASWHYLPLLSGIFTLLELPVSWPKSLFQRLWRRMVPAPPPEASCDEDEEEFLRSLEDDEPRWHARAMQRQRQRLRKREAEAEADKDEEE